VYSFLVHCCGAGVVVATMVAVFVLVVALVLVGASVNVGVDGGDDGEACVFVPVTEVEVVVCSTSIAEVADMLRLIGSASPWLALVFSGCVGVDGSESEEEVC